MEWEPRKGFTRPLPLCEPGFSQTENENLNAQRHHLLLDYVHDQPAGFVSAVEVFHPDKRSELFLNEVGGVGRSPPPRQEEGWERRSRQLPTSRTGGSKGRRSSLLTQLDDLAATGVLE